MHLDVRTLLAVLNLTSLVVGVLLTWAYFSLPRGRGTGEWMFAGWLFTAAWTVMSMRLTHETRSLIALQNSLMLFAMACIAMANRRFVDRGSTDHVMILLAVNAAGIFTVATLVGVGYHERAILFAALGGSFAAYSAWALFKGLPPVGLPARRLGAWLAVLNTLIIITRALPQVSYGGTGTEKMLDPSAWQGVTLLPPTVTLIATAFVFVLMLSEESEARAMELASTDELTECASRRVLEEVVRSELNAVRRRRGSMALVIVDVDHFKKVNDTHGHSVGDAVLRHLAGTLRACVRRSDLLARYGGEEFCIILRDTNAAGAAIFAERARSMLEASTTEAGGRTITVTASFGVAATLLDEPDDWDALFRRADAALYRAKNNGRNRIEVQVSGQLTEQAT